MSLENLKGRLNECRNELRDTNLAGVALLTAASLTHALTHQTVFDGHPLPRHGRFIVTGNHLSSHDALKGHALALKSGRLLRVVVKQSLIERGATESEEYLATLGDSIEKATAEYKPFTGFALRSMDVISILRDRVNNGLNPRINGDLALGLGVAIFLQGHRHADNSLSNLEPGAAIIARKHPDVPIHPLAFSAPPFGVDRVSGIEPTTYNHLKQQYGRTLSLGEITIIIADMVATGLPEGARNIWFNQTRAVEAKRLKATSV